MSSSEASGGVARGLRLALRTHFEALRARSSPLRLTPSVYAALTDPRTWEAAPRCHKIYRELDPIDIRYHEPFPLVEGQDSGTC